MERKTATLQRNEQLERSLLRLFTEYGQGSLEMPEYKARGYALEKTRCYGYDDLSVINQYADQEKEAEAVAFSEWKQENDMKRYIGYVSDEKVWRVYSYAPFYEKGKDFKTTSELYQIFKQQTGNK